jgi:L,D-transpeptidase catalytic domain
VVVGVAAFSGIESGGSTDGTSTSAGSATGLATELPPSPQPAFRPGRPRLLDHGIRRSRFAPVVRDAVAYAAPTTASRSVGRLSRTTSDGTSNIALVTGDALRRDGLWIRVRLAALPNNRSGWVQRSALGGYRFVRTRLVVDRARLRAVLYAAGVAVFRAPVGIGRPEAPTPAGEFYVVDRLAGFGNPFYGPVAFGTSARSPVLTDWPGGGVVGIHGTNEPRLIPGRISHGCIRMRNADILKLKQLLPIGTPLTIV